MLIAGSSGTTTLTGTGALILSNNPNNRIYTNDGSGTLVNDTNHTIEGAGQLGVGLITLTNKGTILANVSNTLTVDTNAGGLNNSGTLHAEGGSTLSITVPAAGLTQTGTIQADASGAVTINTGYIQTAGSTIANGTITVPTITLQGGSLSGTGFVDAKVSNGDSVNAASVYAGNGTTPGALTINGTYAQGSQGTMDVTIGGPNLPNQHVHSLLHVNGTAMLDGMIDVSLVNGTDLFTGDTFDVMNYTSSTGTFSAIDSTNPLYSFSATYNPTDVLLMVTVSPVPGPESVSVLGVGILGLGGLLRNRRRK